MNLSLRLSIVLLILLLPLQSATAQEDPQPVREQPKMELEVMPLAHARANDVASAVHQLRMGATVAVDERTNSLIISSTRDVIDAVTKLAAQLDVQVSSEPVSDEHVVKVYPLQYINATGELALRLEAVFGVSRQSGGRVHGPMRVAHDAGTNQIIVQGPKDRVAMMDDVIAALDRKATGDRAAAEVNMRLVWLVNGDAASGRAVPKDLDDVVEELQRIGIDGLQLAAQTLIRVGSEEDFQAYSVANLATPWHLMVQGAIETGEEGTRRLSIELRGSPTDGTPLETRLITTITTVSGHFVVLGATPIEAMDSVFVVQLTDVR